MRKRTGVIEISVVAYITTIIVLLLNNIHADILEFKNISDYKAKVKVLSDLRETYCDIENPTEKDIIVCNAINEKIAKNLLK